MLKARGLTLIGTLISIAREEGQGALIWFVTESCKGVLARLLACKLQSIPAVGV
jgi:hypothetical protein